MQCTSNIRTPDRRALQIRDAPLTQAGKETSADLPRKLPWLYDLLDRLTTGAGPLNRSRRVALVVSPLHRTVQTALYAFGHYVATRRLKLELDGAV